MSAEQGILGKEQGLVGHGSDTEPCGRRHTIFSEEPPGTVANVGLLTASQRPNWDIELDPGAAAHGVIWAAAKCGSSKNPLNEKRPDRLKP